MSGDTSPSSFLPTYLQRLTHPDIKTVLICGCGGGFDFVHGTLLIPELRRTGKQIVFGSYSFGNPEIIENAEVEYTCLLRYVLKVSLQEFFRDGDVVVRKVTAKSVGSPAYAPEAFDAVQFHT